MTGVAPSVPVQLDFVRLLVGATCTRFGTASTACPRLFFFFGATCTRLRATSAAFPGFLLDATCALLRPSSATFSSLFLLGIGATCTLFRAASGAARCDKGEAGTRHQSG